MRRARRVSVAVFDNDQLAGAGHWPPAAARRTYEHRAAQSGSAGAIHAHRVANMMVLHLRPTPDGAEERHFANPATTTLRDASGAGHAANPLGRPAPQTHMCPASQSALMERLLAGSPQDLAAPQSRSTRAKQRS
ncbi:hypothetical protein ACP70R_003886 [Stipagrostis hirtigluma subsp. patula]